LAKRKIIEEAKCPIYVGNKKTTSHILWGCPMANNVWSLVKGKLQKSRVSNEEFEMIAMHLAKVLSREELEVWTVLSWAIWNARNKFVHEGVQPCPSSIFDRGVGLLKEFHHYQVAAPL
jgi:hypothetical protein